jgi:hypothetical protein
MDEVALVLVVSLLLAFVVRACWRLILNLLVVAAISLIIAAMFFVALGLGQLSDWA